MRRKGDARETTKQGRMGHNPMRFISVSTKETKVARFYTFEHEAKVSDTSHEHATIRFEDGIVSILSRETTRSVRRKWDAIGTYGRLETGHNYVSLSEDSKATRMVGTQLGRINYVIFGLALIAGEFGAIRIMESDGNTTNPDSIRGEIRDRSRDVKRERVQAKFGAIGTVDASAMRAEILARQAARK